MMSVRLTRIASARSRSIRSTVRGRPSLPACRSFAVYAVGEAWTGAMGTGRFDNVVPGHWDNDEDEYETDLPVLVYDDETRPVVQAAVGWGHTALITTSATTRRPEPVESNDSHLPQPVNEDLVVTDPEQNQLLLTGRPFDFVPLMRLRRLPRFLRAYLVRQTVESVDPSQHTWLNAVHPTHLVGRLITFLSRGLANPEEADNWHVGQNFSILADFSPFELPEPPLQVACSAGLTAVITSSGRLLTFGLNGYGQCGMGLTSNNVWQPQMVTGLSTEFATTNRTVLEQQYAIEQVALGFQHGVALDVEGQVFCWGKGDRGQLGQQTETEESHMALPVRKYYRFDEQTSKKNKPIIHELGPVRQIASGMLHSAALTFDNEVLLWGKHVIPTLPMDQKKHKVASDSRMPGVVKGFARPGRTVERIACGSHHTSVLLDDGSVWAVGISSDTQEPMHEPVQLIPPGTVDLPVRQFAAHMDRTTVVGACGRRVVQAHLWKDVALQETAAFTPPFIDRWLDQDESLRIRALHRGWIHSIIVTD